MSLDPSRKGYLVSEQFIRELNNWRRTAVAALERRVTALETRRSRLGEKDLRAAITVGYNPTTENEDPSHYPSSNANTFWVKLAAPSYEKEAGDQELKIDPYDPPVYRLVRTVSGVFIPEGTEVWIKRIHGQYYILPAGELQDAISTSGAAAATLSGGELVCDTFTASLVERKDNGNGTYNLATSSRSVEVVHTTQTPMTSGQRLLLGAMPDGTWTVVVWPC